MTDLDKAVEEAREELRELMHPIHGDIVNERFATLEAALAALGGGNG